MKSRGLLIALFAVGFGTNVATPLFLIYETEMDLTRWTVTALFATYPVGLAATLSFAGPASDSLGRRKLVVPGVLLSGVASLVMMFGIHTLGLLFLGRFLLGAVSGLVFPVASSWMQELDTRSPMWTARVLGMVMYAGFGLGPLVGGILGQWSPWPLTAPYVVHVALVVLALVALRTTPEVVAPTGAPIRPRLGIPRGSERPFWRVLVPTALGVFGFPSLSFGLFPVLLRPAMATIAVFVTGMVFVLAMSLIFPAQAIVARFGAHRAAPVGLAFDAAGTAIGLVSFATGWWGLLFPASVAMGLGSGISMTAGLKMVDELADPRHRGSLTGSFYMAAYFGMLTPLITSTAARVTGFTAALTVLFVLALAMTSWLRDAVNEIARD